MDNRKSVVLKKNLATSYDRKNIVLLHGERIDDDNNDLIYHRVRIEDQQLILSRLAAFASLMYF